MRRPKGAARPRFHTHVYTHGSRHRPHLGLPRPPIKGRLVVLCDADRLATRLVLVPFLSAASIPRGPVPGDPLSHHVEVGTTQECVRVWRPRAVAIPPRRLPTRKSLRGRLPQLSRASSQIFAVVHTLSRGAAVRSLQGAQRVSAGARRSSISTDDCAADGQGRFPL